TPRRCSRPCRCWTRRNGESESFSRATFRAQSIRRRSAASPPAASGRPRSAGSPCRRSSRVAPTTSPPASTRSRRALVRSRLTLSFVESGFRRVLFVNGHYTNYPAINLACFNASPKLPKGTAAWALSYWDALPPDEAEAYLSLATGLHANIGETSAVMAVRPELVKLERAVEGWPPFPELGGPSMPTIFAFF